MSFVDDFSIKIVPVVCGVIVYWTTVLFTWYKIKDQAFLIFAGFLGYGLALVSIINLLVAQSEGKLAQTAAPYVMFIVTIAYMTPRFRRKYEISNTVRGRVLNAFGALLSAIFMFWFTGQLWEILK